MSIARTRIRRSAAEWSALVEACDCSGLSRREFASREGLHRSTFEFWASRLSPRRSASRSAAPAVVAQSFVPVRVRDTEERGSSAHALDAKPRAAAPDKIEVVLRNGRRVRCQLSQVDDPRLAALLTLAEGVA